ncbi:alpha-hydroxy-acid oxidizing enzyme [Sphingomonas sp. Leaf67]|uniref:FMN-dependent L-lactate dehydrogenase LldD n=1 Tax=unclassified Sphingomonas TaxID=196159 RepID=UPI0006FB3803|nr:MULTISPECIES: FMN-dependent L-lactate dehydrogenase LldD [unclassified Sphingomonas]KQM89550.1 alpha-hydroxy-acid oxidizing enzyme [Sphingomonas sp. Leaf22]KQN89741.1 alpha-hydroxy-acid oxidizing enzyme [Sphingomonas sp. Leaf67]
MIISSASDFREAARRRVPRFLFDYADGGANGEETLRCNVSDLAGIGLRQRVLRDVAAIDLTTNLFGRQIALPLALGPVGIGGMYARRGEVQAARAAAAAGVPACLSTVSICSIDEVAAVADPFWFQLYVLRDRAFMRDLIAQAKAAGAGVLVFTVDMPVPGARYRDAHAGMSGPRAPLRRVMQTLGRPHWAWNVGLRGRPHMLGNLLPVLGSDSGLNDYMGWLAKNFDPSIRWSDLDWIRAAWDGPLVIKGILDPEDAREAVRIGADGIVVSNHGGRQLDGVLSTARALPAIADAVGDALSVLADGGIRSGLDVVRMLALGAKGVLLGRAWIYALAAQGEAGVARLVDLIAREMTVAMTLTGVNRIAAIDRSILADPALRLTAGATA